MNDKKNKKFSDLTVKQSADTLMKYTKGADFRFNTPENFDLGKIDVVQQSPIMQNVTGMSMQFGQNSGEVRAKECILVEQKTGGGASRVEINAHLPCVEVTFNKKDK